MGDFCDDFPGQFDCPEKEDPIDDPVEEEEDLIPDDDPDNGDGGDDEEDNGDEEEPDMDEGDEYADPKSPYQKWLQMARLMTVHNYDPFKGQIAFLFLSLGMAARAGMNAFRYHGWGSNQVADVTKNEWYSQWKYVSDTEWFKLSRQIGDYGSLAIWGVAFLFQLLSTAGIASGINAMVWIYVVGMGELLLSVVVDVIRFLAYDGAWTKVKVENATGDAKSDQKVANRIIGEVERDVALDMAGAAMSTIVWLLHGDNWMWAQYENLAPEDQDAYMEMIDETLAAWEEEAAEEAAEDEEAAADMEEAEEDLEEVADEEMPGEEDDGEAAEEEI